mgnify:CR=1 FL=1
MSTQAALVQSFSNYGNILRDDGLTYGDYVEQLTLLQFLKMADEQSQPPSDQPSPISKSYVSLRSLGRGRDESMEFASLDQFSLQRIKPPTALIHLCKRAFTSKLGQSSVGRK